MKRTTLSFLTESKASAVGFSAMRRVAMTLLVMLLTTASVWAQDGPAIPTPKITTKVTPENGGTVSAPIEAKMGTQVQFTVTPADGYKIKNVSLSDPGIYDLSGSLETGHYSFTIRSSDVTITVVFEELEFIPKYTIINENEKKAMLSGYKGKQPTGALNIPNNVTINGISYSVTSIGVDAFKDCSSLASVTIPNSVTSIGAQAFRGCKALQSVTIPNSVTNIGGSAFEGCKALQSVTIPNRVTNIGGFAFCGCSSLESVTIPNSVKSIDNGVFYGCSSLESVTIPNSVKSIGSYAFYGCSSTTSINIPNSVTSIDDKAFSGCSGLTSITVEEGNTYYDSRNNCNAIIETKSNTLILGCKNTIIPTSVTSIGNDAFFDCVSLESVTIPNSVTSIGNSAFQNCALTSVTIPNSVTSIGKSAFSGCRSLESVTIPNSVTSIGNNAFGGCSNLQSVTIPNSVTSIDANAFDGCSSLQSVTIPNSVTSIGNYAFYGCSSLESVTIPNSVMSIGYAAFQRCGLTSITIPNSVTNIDYTAFLNCKNLTSVTLYSNPKIGANAFKGTPATVTMNLTASNVNGDKWTTFYNDGYNFQADENTTVYKATVDGSSLVLTEVEDKIVNSETAVILKSSGNPVMTLTETGSNDTNGNDLRGISDRDLRTSVISNFSANEIYTMGNTSVGFGFHRYTGEFVPAGKAFLPLYTSDGAKAQSLTIVFAIGSTGIKSVSSDSNVQNDWFSLDGTRLNGKPSQPGIYVNGKKKVVVK